MFDDGGTISELPVAVQQYFAVFLAGSEMAGSGASNVKDLDALSCLCYLSVDVRSSVHSQDPG